MTALVAVTAPGDQHAPRHAHGIGCCWDCFDGLRVHPEFPGDPRCKDREGDDGHCMYEGRQ